VIWKIIIELRTQRRTQMNKEWSELNKLMQSRIKKRDIYEEGISTLLVLRNDLWNTIISFKDELYNYLSDVKQSTEAILWDLSYEDLKRKISVERKEQLESLSVVSKDESAIWLIDYWCNKDVRGLIQMPFSRHWIMHIEACLRIKKKIHS
jgi:hypothetical protein